MVKIKKITKSGILLSGEIHFEAGSLSRLAFGSGRKSPLGRSLPGWFVA
jgi:hypothetical protein